MLYCIDLENEISVSLEMARTYDYFLDASEISFLI